jgi:hypothetical protein
MVERALENPQDFRAAQEIQNLREERLMKEVIKGLSKTGYTLLGDQKPTARHSACFGYKVEWSGLDPENAEIVKMRIEKGGLNS